MKVSYQWLSEYVDLSQQTPTSLADLLTSAGLAVDAVEPRNQGVVNVVVGYVTSVERHPDADKLNVCQVDVGQGELQQIVCGAPNVVSGMKAPVALPGAKLPGGKEIGRAKLRGVTSNGMLCSASELGLDTRYLPANQSNGLYVLPDDTPVGLDIVKALNLDDVILDVDLTPNRSDCLSIRGFAYEIAALLGQKTNFPTEIAVELPEQKSPIRVKIESERCVRYDAIALENLKANQSPLWMQMRLMAMGVRSIDLIVDVTNYVMLEWGQPLHAFDAGKITDQTIVVRQANAGEHLTTLDGQDRELDEEMLVIADPARSIGLAGVMGGENSEIDANTTRIVIESARFDAPSTRRTGQKLGLRSEAQQRFEKGIDPATVRNALLRATQLLVELGPAEATGGVVTDRNTEADSHLGHTVAFSPEKCRQLLGTHISDTDMAGILGRLGFGITMHADGWTVSVPTRRPDVSMQADLAEEIARIYGYDNIPSTTPSGPITAGTRDARQQFLETVRTSLAELGLFEVRTYAFSAPAALEALQLPKDAWQTRMIPLLYPMSDERSGLRTHLLPSLAEVARHNLSHRTMGGAIFELGRVYQAQEFPIEAQPVEQEQIALMWFGDTDEDLYETQRPYDFYDALGIVERVIGSMTRGGKVTVERATDPWLHPGRSAKMSVNGNTVARFGQLHPVTAEKLDIPHALYAEIYVDALLSLPSAEVALRPLPRFPGARRDIALMVDADVAVGDLKGLLEQAGEHTQVGILQEVRVFDVYTGKGVAEGQKSVAFGLQFQASERTLTDGEIDEVVQAAVAQAEAKFGAKLRS